MARALVEDTSSEDLVRIYLREIGKHRLLNAEQEVALAKAIEAGAKATARLQKANGDLSAATRTKLDRHVADGQKAHRAFIEANLRLVVSIARRYQGFGLSLLDLIQEGNLGLLRAVEKYDWRRGFKFSTYATWWIRQGITRGLADKSRTIRVPVHVADVLNRMRHVEAALSTELGHDPSDMQVASALGVSVDQVVAYRQLAAGTLSLSTPIGEDGAAELYDFIEDELCEQPMEEAIRTRSAEELREALGSLSGREQRILELRYGLADGREKTLEQVGREFKLTRERIRQIEAKALSKLRHPARRTELDAFLD